MGGLATFGGVIATVARGIAIWIVAALCVVAYSIGSVRRLAIRDRTARLEARARQRGALLRWSFSRLGASFIKIGQVMSARADLLAPGIIAELRELQDHVAPFPFAHARAIVEAELRARIESRFRRFDPVPVAAGSIAQVHYAVLHDGEEVAVKILRPGIRARVRRDARIMLWLAHFAHVVSARARAAQVIAQTRGLIAGLLAQTDLRREADNYDLFRTHFAGVHGLAFPRVFRGLSTPTVLTMEFIHGVRVEHVPERHVAQVTRVLRQTFFAMCFQHGLVHADLHPGNVLVRDDGTVVVIDVGLVKQLSPTVLDQIVDFARCLVMGSAADLVKHLQLHHEYVRPPDWNDVIGDADAFVAHLRAHSLAELELSVVVARLFALARKHRIRPISDLSLVLLGMVTIEGMAKRLDPAANTMAEIARYLGPRIAQTRRLARGSREWLPSQLPRLLPPAPEPLSSAADPATTISK